MEFFNHLKTILQQNARFVKDGKLFKNTLVQAAAQLDEELLALLMSDEKILGYFFKEINGNWVFDILKFQNFIQNKALFNNSFTAFKNKIGLATDKNLISDRSEVVLHFPFKDAVLEGGQSKEEQKREEIFWNQTLDKEEIDRMLSPKVFVNWKRIDENGTQNLAELRSQDNFIIRGNNLIALHSLKKNFREKFKLIYIDPPYNTGNDSFQYNDRFNHSSWLVFMKNRLEAAWDLLNKEGAFFIQVDDSEFAYLKVLCDEIFGRENFRETIVLKSSTESGVNAINVKRGERLFKVKEYILFYSKSPKFRFKPFYTSSKFNFNYKYEVIPNKEGYSITDISKKIKQELEPLEIGSSEKKILMQSALKKYALAHAEHMYSLEKNIKKAGAQFKEFAAKNKSKNKVEEWGNSNGEIKLMYQGGVLVPLKERLVHEGKQANFGVLASDLWMDIPTTSANEGGIKFSNGKKPEKLLHRIIEMCTEEGDWVLDYHLGSGTTAAVAHKMKRQYIGIEQLDYGENDATVRLQNVINGEQTGISKVQNWKGGGSFVYTELAPNNMKFLEELVPLKNNEALQEWQNKVLQTPYLDPKISATTLMENPQELQTLSVYKQKEIHLALLDKNELYVHYSEMEDEYFAISEEDKQLTRQFYDL